MRFRDYVLKISIVALVVYAGCKDNPTEPVPTAASTISGKVQYIGTSVPITNAYVEVIGALARADSVDSNGSFSIPLGVLTSRYNPTLRATAAGLLTIDTALSIEVGASPSVIISMRLDTTTSGGSGSSGAQSIELLNPTESHVIALKGTGHNESLSLTFVVKDSSGNPIVAPNQSWVNFILISSTSSGGAFLKPDSALTNPLNGQVTITVSSGTLPTILQVYASVRGTNASARPVVIGAGGGLADNNRVSLGATVLNIAGRVYGNLRTTLTLSAADRFGSPVFANTPVQFECNYGKLSKQQGLSFTDGEGNAVIDLISTTNFPPTSAVLVTATTSGDSSINIVKQGSVIFSGHTRTPERGANTLNFTVPDGLTQSFDFRVSDDLGFPLVQGSTVKITMTAADTLLKDLQLLFGVNGVYTFPDTRDTMATFLRAGVLDKGVSTIAGLITFGIEINSVNGNYNDPNWFTGYVSGGGTGNFNVPASIELADSSVMSLYLQESGLTSWTTRRLYFIVKDALGNTIRPPSKARVDFSFQQQPGGVTRSPLFDSTSASGMVHVDITSGNSYGIAIVEAQLTGYGVSAFSLPIEVAHGLPDSNNVFIELNKKNMFNNYGVEVGTVKLSLSDTYGSYAAPQSAPSDITVTTTGGFVNAIVPLSVSGKTSVSLYGSSNEPNDPTLGPGFGYVRAMMRVRGGTTTKSVPFMFSYAPQIAFIDPTIVDTATNTLWASLTDQGMIDVEFRVWDKNHNPISSGNSINVTVSGAVATDIGVTGDVNLTLPETQDPSSTRYRFSISDKNVVATSQGAFTVTITVSGESGTATKQLKGYLLAPGVIGGGTSGYAKSFMLIDPLKKRSIYVRGSGGSGTGRPETATLEIQAVDSLGRNIDADHAILMQFAFQGENFGATIERESGLTDANGRFTTLIRSGTHSGVPYVYAFAVVNGDTIKSGLIDILISSGFADPFRFSVSAERLNFPGMQIDGITDLVRVQPFDKFGNPVPENTPVWFYCTHGGVQTEAAYTDINGIKTQLHYSGGTRPCIDFNGVDNRTPGQSAGFMFVKARTMGENGLDIWDSVKVLWTGAQFSLYNDASLWASTPVNERPPHFWTVERGDSTGAYVPSGMMPDTFTVYHGGSAGPWHYQIRDFWGNPLSEGTQITVSCEGAKIAGTVSRRLPDSQAGANGTPSGMTDYYVAISDAEGKTPHEPISTFLVVKVTHSLPQYGETDFIIARGVIY